MAVYKAVGRVAAGGKVVEPGDRFEHEHDTALRTLAARGVVELVVPDQPEPEPEPPPTRRRPTDPSLPSPRIPRGGGGVYAS